MIKHLSQSEGDHEHDAVTSQRTHRPMERKHPTSFVTPRLMMMFRITQAAVATRCTLTPIGSKDP
jgi:hypothetical protein